MLPNTLSLFHPMIARWFSDTFGPPTAIQANAWQTIAQNQHVLLTAPTGSGKTLAAFLWSLDRLITRHWPTGCTQVVYVSPLKALNNDVQRNLLTPLKSLRHVFEQKGQTVPHITVATRSGDTPPAQRRRMVRQPPEILITTPESLNLLLSSAGGRVILETVQTVILDELHAIMDSRRGTYLITAVERLTRLAGEFQRIALSATIHPMDMAARFVGGFQLHGDAAHPVFTPRNVTIIAAEPLKSYALQVRCPPPDDPSIPPNTYWAAYAEQIKTHIRVNRATLIFTNSRQLCEKLTYLMNRSESELVAYAHHGSLSRDIRAEVEKRLKNGDLRAIVATNSLELGIDIGELDEVVLVQSPASVTEAVQRVGRAGHGVGRVSRGTFYPTHGMDIVTTVVLAAAVDQGRIETIHPIMAPLDVLAQVMVSMCAFETWQPDALYGFIRTATPYHHLSRDPFDRVIHLLEGRYEQTRLRELQPRILYDRIEGTLSAKKGALLTLYTAGGVIPDRGYYNLRHGESDAKIGELDEEFVWEARVGQVFTLGTQNWRIQKITHSDVWVLPAPQGQPAPPFWKAEGMARGFHLSERIGQFMEKAQAELETPAFDHHLHQTYHLDVETSQRLKTFLLRQRAHTGCALPHRRHLVIEYTTLGPGGPASLQIVWHTLWGGRVNRPLAVAMEAAWEEKYGDPPHIFASNDSLSFVLPRDIPAEEMLALVPADQVKQLLHKRLAGTGFFGARFRECAGRALLLPRQQYNQRMPLWLNRLRAGKLMAAVSTYTEFPILMETWRTCLQDEFDLPALENCLRELEQGQITWTAVQTRSPSPLARNSAWQPINIAMYQNDQGAQGRSGRLSEDLLFEITLDPNLRPQIDPGVAAAFEEKRQRLARGYSPDSPEELLDWIKERVALPRTQWQALVAAMIRDHGSATQAYGHQLKEKLVCLRPHPEQENAQDLIMATEVLPRWRSAFSGAPSEAWTITSLNGDPVPAQTPPTLANDLTEDRETDLSPSAVLLAEWLRFYGPLPKTELARNLGIPMSRLQLLLDELIDTRTIVSGALRRNSDPEEICDRENFEILLRIARRAAVPVFKALAPEALPLFLAQFQGLTQKRSIAADLSRHLEQLLAWPAPAGLWETDLLPARLPDYRPEWLDKLLQNGELLWVGSEGRKVMFCYEDELDLLLPDNATMETKNQTENAMALQDHPLFSDPDGRYPFSALLRSSGLSPADLNTRIWALVWQGQVSNDTFTALRRGIETRFKLPATTATAGARRSRSRHRPGRAEFQRWRSLQPFVGNWYTLAYPDSASDPLDREEGHKARIRLLMERYGIIFRELLTRELPMLQWKSLFRALRIMELSGEVLSGQFFKEIPGPQFISPSALNVLGNELHQDAIFWINALDPASICGLGLNCFNTSSLPKRLPGNHLVYHGTELKLISRQQGRHLTIRVPADHPCLEQYLSFLHHLLTRPVNPLRSLRIDTINHQPAVKQTNYSAVLDNLFEVVTDPKSITLYQRHKI